MKSSVVFAVGVVTGMGLMMSMGFAHSPPHSPVEELAEAGEEGGVVPESEKELAQVKQIEGPTKTQGIEGVKTLMNLDLGEEFSCMKGVVLRARELELGPEAIVAVHEHTRRPGMAYILEGEMTEVRNDGKGAHLRRAGDASLERSGVTHYWENRSGKKAKALVIDLVPQP